MPPTNISVEAARLFIRDQRVLVKVALAFLVCLLAGFLPFGAWAKENNFEGTITATEENGQAPTAFLYTRKGDLVRIETPDAKTPVPINVLNLAQQKLTIIYPHNRSFVNVDLITKPASVAGKIGATRFEKVLGLLNEAYRPASAKAVTSTSTVTSSKLVAAESLRDSETTPEVADIDRNRPGNAMSSTAVMTAPGLTVSG